MKAKEHQAAARTIQERSAGASDLSETVQQEVTLAALCATFALAYAKAAEVADDAEPSSDPPSDPPDRDRANDRRKKQH